MNSSLMRGLFYSLALAASMAAFPAASQEGVALTIRVAGLTSTKGLLHYALYAEGDAFPGRRTARYRDEIPVDRVDFVFTIKGVPPGAYALIVAHDEDGDGEIATPNLFNFFSGEKVGVTNYSSRLFAAPSFERARFELRAPRMELDVALFPTGVF
jgi:uncharacterized protein (DUF2141 family)